MIKLMSVSEFLRLVVGTVDKVGKVGKGEDKPITIYWNGNSVVIGDVIWHEDCQEFHIMPKMKKVG